jgi:NAD(P)-dependent dehydrogenase (short-subunit alcohol dehydrogenase family)
MELNNTVAIVTGGASGLGLASAKRLIAGGALVLIVDLERSNGAEIAAELGHATQFAAADVTDEAAMAAAVAQAETIGPPVRILVHCAGKGGAKRVVEKDGSPMPLAHFADIINTNLIGTFNALRLAAAAMAKTEPLNGERGVCVLTASVAGYEGQVGQAPYAASKAGVIGLTICAARDLASRAIRVCTIAPGIMDTPMLGRLPDNIRASLAASVPNPARLGEPDEYALLARQIIENPYLNGETIRLDGALRMGFR